MSNDRHIQKYSIYTYLLPISEKRVNSLFYLIIPKGELTLILHILHQLVVIRPGQNSLDDGDIAHGKGAFAVGKIEIPFTDEGFIKAQVLNFGTVAVETFTP